MISKLYEAVRGNNDSLTYQIAETILASIHARKNRIAVVTGFYSSEFLPKGESDGPYGALVLAKAMEDIGARVSVLIERESVEITRKLADYLGMKGVVYSLNRTEDAANAQFAEQLDAVVFTEKCGPSKEEVYHFATGGSRHGEDAPLKGFLDKMNNAGKLTIGVGDNGNEIGFGKIFDAAREIIKPYGNQCKCPKNEGIVTYYATQHLLPASISNVGCYGIVSALALLSGNLKILHTPEKEMELIQMGTGMGLVDGGYGKVHNYVDGVPAASMCATVDLLRVLPILYYDNERRDF
jgi:hypothetical protein